MHDEEIPDEKRIRAHRRTIQDYKRTFSEEHGKRVLIDMVKAAGFGRSNFVPGQPDATAYNLGQMDFVRRVLRLVQMNEEALARMLIEPEAVDIDGG